jgi:glutamine synthetase adenylyltransferase
MKMEIQMEFLSYGRNQRFVKRKMAFLMQKREFHRKKTKKEKGKGKTNAIDIKLKPLY